MAPAFQAKIENIQAELASTKAELQKLKTQNQKLQKLSSNQPDPLPTSGHVIHAVICQPLQSVCGPPFGDVHFTLSPSVHNNDRLSCAVSAGACHS